MNLQRALSATALAVLLFPASAFAAPPANDNFASAITIGALPYTDTKSTVEATNEVDEPATQCGGSRSIWYKFTAATTGHIVADTVGSSFDTELALYKGATLATLSLVDCNDDRIGLISQLPFAVEAGQTYYIRGAGYAASTGTYKLNLSTVSPALYTQCPPAGRNAGCEYLVTAEPGGYTVATDPNAYSYARNFANGLVGVVNDSGADLCTLGWTDSSSFNFASPQHGLCGVTPHPAMCPFGPTGYEGPGVQLDALWDTHSGVVRFDPCVPHGGTAYFTISGSPENGFELCNGNEVCEVGETTANCRTDCPPDTDGDGVLDNTDNCINAANAGQEDVDADDVGNPCDSLDNNLVIKLASMKTKPTGAFAMVKGTINETAPVDDLPSAAGGILAIVYDQTFTYMEVEFAPEECLQTATKITCVKPDKSASLKIPLGGLDRDKVPFKLKIFAMGAPIAPSYSGPIVTYLLDLATDVDRTGTSASTCTGDDLKITCKP